MAGTIKKVKLGGSPMFEWRQKHSCGCTSTVTMVECGKGVYKAACKERKRRNGVKCSACLPS